MKILSEKRSRKIAPYLFVLPNLLIFLFFVVIPAFYGLFYSFTDFDGLSDINFVGLDNYIKIMQNTEFWRTLGRTAFYAALVVPLIFAFALGIAMIIIREIRAKGLFRAVFYWPTMISFIIVGVIWKWIFGDNFGFLNYTLTLAAMEPVKWLTNDFYANVAAVVATVWSRIGFFMIIFIGGLQSIPISYYEAAVIDGATKMQMFRRITLPLLKPTSVMVLILAIIDAFKAYPLIFSLTGGGPGKSTTYLVQYIYQYGFERNEIGYASAMSVILFLIVGLLTLFQFRSSKGGRIE